MVSRCGNSAECTINSLAQRIWLWGLTHLEKNSIAWLASPASLWNAGHSAGNDTGHTTERIVSAFMPWREVGSSSFYRSRRLFLGGRAWLGLGMRLLQARGFVHTRARSPSE